MYSNPEGHKDIIDIEIVTMNLPKDYLRKAKVLKGGLQLSYMAVSKWFYEDPYLEKHMGDAYDVNSAKNMAHDMAVVQPVCKQFSGGQDPWIFGKPAIINLPFKNIEGDITAFGGNWSTAGMMRVQNHHQFQKTMTFYLVSVEDKLESHQLDEDQFCGFADGNHMDDQEEVGQVQME